ncbi:MAG TPA: hypothetical protein VGD58_28755 [Herpetosiphonaceae bacterium]
MIMHIHRYIEISAPLEVTRDLLIEQPPLDVERLGELWRWQDELWTIERSSFDDGRSLWHGTCLGLPEASFLLSATLHDAAIATHVEVHLAVTLPRSLWHPLGARRRARAIAAGLDAALAALCRGSRQHAPTAIMPCELPDDPQQLAEALIATHPETVAAFRQMQALPSLQAIAQLDRRWQATEAGAFAEDVYQPVESLPSTLANFDLIYAGGGLGVLHAAVMACRYSYRILLFDRGDVGCAHREWNISDRELQALVTIGLFKQAELEQVIMRRYSDGIVRFYPEQSAIRPAELHLPDVLNVALDAAGLLKLARSKIEAAGGVVLDRRSFKRTSVEAPGRIAVEVTREDGRRECYGGRVLLDGMGATSPLALRRFAGQPFAGVCPTVGTVVEGLEQGPELDQHHPEVGDILVSIADTQRDRQLIWEGFGGRGDELTVYVFYYDLLKNQEPRTRNLTKEQRTKNKEQGNKRAKEQSSTETSPSPVATEAEASRGSGKGGPGGESQDKEQTNKETNEQSGSDLPPRLPQPRSKPTEVRGRGSRRSDGGEGQPPRSLLDLFEDYFRLLPTYKRPGPDFRHIKPVYGFIPARHTQRRQTVPLLPGVLPIGDSSAQQSPLTFCGFGSHVRNLQRTTTLLDHALRRDLLAPEYLSQISAYQANVALNWVFSRFMQPWGAPNDVNRLQNIFARVLNEVGVDVAVRFFQDQMTWRDYGRIVNHTLAIYKPIIPTALTVLGPRDTARWIVDWLRFSVAAAEAALGRQIGDSALDALTARIDRVVPGWAFRIAARRAEWQVMGWTDHASITAI